MNKFRVVLVSMILLFAFSSFAGTPGIISGTTSLPAVISDDCIRGMMAFYDMKKLIGSVDNADITITSKWTPPSGFRYSCCALYNNSATTVEVRVCTRISPTPAAADTIRLKIAPYSCTFKLPELFKIFQIGATDTLIALLQLMR
jgi:hypothetical protein